MKLKLYSTVALLVAGLLSVNNASAQWSRNAPTAQTFLTNIGDNVGIGTNNPLFKLDVQNAGIATMNFKSATDNASFLLDRGAGNKTASVTYRSSGSNLWQTGIVNNDNYQIRNNVLAAPAITVLSANSNVGLGIANPTEKLHVSGNILATGNVTAVNFIGSGNIDVNGYVGFGSVEQLTDGGANTIASNSNFVPTIDCSRNLGTALLRWNDIHACGDVRVGTTTAVAAQLSVAHTTLSGIAGTGSFQIGETNTLNLVMDNNEIQARSNGATNTLFLQFNGGNIDANFGGGNALFHGNVGIGTSSPVTTLHILGGTDANLTTGGYIITGPTTGASISIDDNEIIARNNGAVSTLFLNNNGGDLAISASGTGNVGIGTSAPAQRIHVRQNTANRAIEWQHETTTDFWTVGIGTSTLNGRFEFNGTGKAQISSVDGTYSTISDARLKEDITPLTSVLDKVMELKPSTYYYTSSRNRASNKSIGFIAQEVEQIFPQLIHNDDEGYKWLSYSEFAVIAIKAIQEMETKIDSKEALTQQLIKDNADLKKENAEMKARMDQFEKALSQCCTNFNAPADKQSINNATDVPMLEQNQPNPFNQSSVIKYYVPSSYRTAQLIITDLNGVQLKTFNIGQSGVGQVVINANELASGTYLYSLIIDGSKVESKKMELTR